MSQPLQKTSKARDPINLSTQHMTRALSLKKDSAKVVEYARQDHQAIGDRARLKQI
jgi:hypothetical protein